MAYSNALDAFARLTGVTHDGNSLPGALGVVIEKLVEHGLLKADGDSTPVARPVALVDARAFVRFLGQGSAIAETATAGNIIASFTATDGGSGNVTIGPMKAGSVTHQGEEGQSSSSKYCTQEFLFQGTSLTYSVTI